MPVDLSFHDLEVSPFRPNWTAVSGGFLDDFKYESTGQGLATPWRTTGSVIRRQFSLPIVLRGIDEIAAFRQFLDRRRGPQLAVWQPNYIAESRIAEDASADDTNITLTGQRFLAQYAGGPQCRYIALVDRDGRLECYGVSSVSSSGDDVVLTLERGLDNDVIASQTVCCSLILARLDGDEFEINHLSGEIATVTLDFIECPTEYPATVGTSVADTYEYGSRPVFLYEITDGTTTLLYADYGVDIEAAALTWQAADIMGGELLSTLDMLGDSLRITLRSDDPDLPLLDYLDPLNFRNYEITIYLLNLDEITLLDLDAPEHRGRIESVEDAGQGALRIEISSLFRLNERRFPQLGYQRQCNHDTYSAACGADIGTFTTTTTIAAIQNTSPPYVEAVEFGDKATAESDPNWFALGRVTVGDEIRICTGQDGDRLYLNMPFKRAAVLDSISAIAGDDHRVATCDGKFGRLVSHLGFTFQPVRNPQLQALELPKKKAGKK